MKRLASMIAVAMPLTAMASMPYYPATNGMVFTNSMVCVLYSGIVERCSISGIDPPEVVETYYVFSGYTNTVTTNGATVYTNKYSTYAPVTLTNVFWDFVYATNSVTTTNRPHFTRNTFATLDDKLDDLAPEFTRYWERGTNATWIPWIWAGGNESNWNVNLPRLTVSTCLWKNAMGTNIGGTYYYTHAGTNLNRLGTADYNERMAVLNTLRDTDYNEDPYVEQNIVTSMTEEPGWLQDGCLNIVCAETNVLIQITDLTYINELSWRYVVKLSEQAEVYTNPTISCENPVGTPLDNRRPHSAQVNIGTTSNSMTAVYPIRYDIGEESFNFTAHSYLIQGPIIYEAEDPGYLLTNSLQTLCKDFEWYFSGSATNRLLDAGGIYGIDIWAGGGLLSTADGGLDTVCVDLGEFNTWGYVLHGTVWECDDFCDPDWYGVDGLRGRYEIKGRGLSHVEWDFNYMTTERP